MISSRGEEIVTTYRHPSVDTRIICVHIVDIRQIGCIRREIAMLPYQLNGHLYHLQKGMRTKCDGRVPRPTRNKNSIVG